MPKNEYLANGARRQNYKEKYQGVKALREHDACEKSLYEILDGRTSDHAYRELEVKADGLTLRVGTYNMLERCKPLGSNTITCNNPALVTEDAEAYQARKQAQILFLVDMMNKKDSPDCILLQEADWIEETDTEPDGQKRAANIEAKKAIKAEILQVAKDFGYVLHLPPENTKIQNLAVLVKINSPLHEANKKPRMTPVVPNSKNSKFRALKMDFVTDKNQKISIINAHLEYDVKYADFPDLFKADDDDLVIVGGDMNHHVGDDLPYLIATKEASVLSCEKERKSKETVKPPKIVEGEPVYTDKHEGDKNAAYDGFMLKPIKDTHTTAQIVDGEYVVLEKNKPKFKHLIQDNPKGQNIKRKKRQITSDGKLFKRWPKESETAAAGAKLINLKKNKNASDRVVDAQRKLRREYRNNIDVLLYCKEALPSNLKTQISTQPLGSIIPVGESDYLIVNHELKEANAKGASLLDSQKAAYLSIKNPQSGLFKAYQADKPSAELHQKAQLKKWTLRERENLPPSMSKQLQGATQVLSMVQVKDEKLVDLVKLYDTGQDPIFYDFNQIVNQLAAHKVELEINDQTFRVGAKIREDGKLIFIHADTKKSITQSEVDAFRAANEGKSLSMAVLNQLLMKMKVNVAVIDDPNDPKPHKPSM